jgi:uncharacterized C2H2 Zn-finger protein
MSTTKYINSKLECPVCSIFKARNYLMCHLQKQHSNIWGKPEWISSRYALKFQKIKDADRANRDALHSQKDQGEELVHG